MTWVQTYTGVAFDLADPRPEDINLEDIAHALSNICRFTGHARPFYSVAEHSILVSRFCAYPAHGLMHDAAEAYIGDVSNPLKRLLRDETPWLDIIEERVHEAICERFGLDYEGMWDHIKEVDIRACVTEASTVLGEPPRLWDPAYTSVKPFDWVVSGFNPRDAKRLFLARAQACGLE